MGIVEPDYNILIAPYADMTATWPGTPIMTVELIRAWLLKRGITEGIADDAIRIVFTEMAAGKVFEAKDNHPAGHWLCRYTLETARALMLKSGPPMMGLNRDDVSAIAAFSRSALKFSFWKGVAIGVVVASLLIGVGGYALWP